MDSDTEALLSEDKDRSQIREELSKMSFEELQKLKEKCGTKMYNAAMFGMKKIKKPEFKRENKNRPREMSSKKKVSRLREVIAVQKKISRDPRFDSLCGTFNERAFKSSYSFLTDVKQNDLKKLHKELETEEDPKTIKKIKYLIQRLENQLREEGRLREKKEKQAEEKQDIIKSAKEGKKLSFKKKSEKKLLNFVAQYEELKASGRLKKHIQRFRKKNVTKDRRRQESLISE